MSCMLGQGLYTTGFIHHSVILWMKRCHDYRGSSISALLRIIDLLLSHLPHHHQILCIMMVPTTASQNHPPSTTCIHVNQTWIYAKFKHAQMTTIPLDSSYRKQQMTFLLVFQIITDAILFYCRLCISKTKHSEMNTWVQLSMLFMA